MAKRVYIESVKKWAKGAGISGVSLFGLIFMYLIAVGSISSVSYSGDVVCAGTIEDPCYAFINFTAEEDIFIYPTGYDPWGRETLFNFNPEVKSWRLERSWGTSWRNIPINTTCTGTWCGAKDNKGCAYSMAFRKDRDYQIRIVAYKNSPTDTLKWGAFSGVDEIDPFWYGVNTTATTLVSNNISVELGVALNFTTNITGAATTCVDIDHPDYGDNYTCGTPNANFTLNISYFRKTEFDDGETEKTMNSTYTLLNQSSNSGGSYGTSSPKHYCAEYYVDTISTKFQVTYQVWSWVKGSDYISDTELTPYVTIMNSDRELMETIPDLIWNESGLNGNGDSYWIGEATSNDVYTSGLYGICVNVDWGLKPPQTDHTLLSGSGSKTIDVGWNYNVNWSRSTILSDNAFGTNVLTHKYIYKNGTNVSQTHNFGIEGWVNHAFTNPWPTEGVDLIEVSISSGSGSGGFQEKNTTSQFYPQLTAGGYYDNGGGFSVRTSDCVYYGTCDMYQYDDAGGLNNAPYTQVYGQNDSTFYVSAHQYDEVQDFKINLTGIEQAKNVKIYVNGTLSNTLGFIYNTSSGNISETAETSFNLLSGNSTTFSIPKGATVTNTTLNFTGSNATWETSEYSIPSTWSSSYGAPSPALPSGVQSWLGPASDAVDGNIYSGTGGWIDGPTLWDVEWMAYIEEDYIKDTSAMTANWSSSYSCSSNDDITFDTDCWSGSSWVEVLSKTGTNCGSYAYEVYALPVTCVAQSILQIKNSLQYGDVGYGTVQRAYYHEGKVNYYRTASPTNLTIEVGIVDGAYEYQGSGELTGSDSTTDFVAEVNSFLDTCAADEDDYCDVPIYFNSDDGGILKIDNIEILYTYDPNPVIISSSIIQSFLNGSSDDVDIPIYFSMTEGSFNVSALQYDYKGGNDTIEVFAWDYSSTLTDQSINNFYDESASTNISLGTFTKFLDIPMEAELSWASLNFTGYNQSGYCYQEHTNVATDCGGLATGNTSVPEGNWYNQANEYTYDGDWATGSRSYSGTVYGWMNYTKPSDSGIDGTYWQIKSGTGTQNLSLSAACWSQSPLQLRFAGTTSASYWYCYNGTAYETLLGGVNREIYEEAMWWNLTNFPTNVSLEIGDSDGDYEWNESGYVQNNITGNLSSDIATVISDGCSCDSCELKDFNHICSVPFIFNMNSVGELELHNLNVTYETMGNLSNNETFSVFAYFSSFFKNLPYTWANKLFFIPKTNSSKNVTAYGQTTTIPAYNLTTTNYGGDINLSIRVDESFSCLNITWSNNATKNQSNVINTTWQTLNSNVEYLNNTKLWLWADFDNCNASDQRILQPSLQIEGYCINCEWI